MINKKLKIALLYFSTIKSYGIFNSAKVLFFEVIGLIYFQDINSLNYDDEKTSKYSESKKFEKYDVPYIPTPFYFLFLIKKTLIKLNIKKMKLIDIGCGYCRPAKYLARKFELSFSGIELNRSIAHKIIGENNHNFNIYNFNLRNLIKTKSFFKKNLNKNICNVIIISDTVEINQINKILHRLNNKVKIILIFININYKKFNNKKFKVIKKIFFKEKSRNIIFLRNYK